MATSLAFAEAFVQLIRESEESETCPFCFHNLRSLLCTFTNKVAPARGKIVQKPGFESYLYGKRNKGSKKTWKVKAGKVVVLDRSSTKIKVILIFN